jgi:hypothetical protein
MSFEPPRGKPLKTAAKEPLGSETGIVVHVARKFRLPDDLRI